MTTLQNRRTVFGLNNSEVMSNAAPSSEAGIEKSEGQDGFFIYSKKAYSLWLKDQGGSWSLYNSYDLSEIENGNAFSWDTNVAAFIQTQEASHKVSVFIIEDKLATNFKNPEAKLLSSGGVNRFDAHSNYRKVRMQNCGHTGEAFALAAFDSNGDAVFVSAPPSGQRVGKVLGWDENGDLGWIEDVSSTVDIMGETDGIENDATVYGAAYFSNAGAAIFDGASHLEADSNLHHDDQFQASAAIKTTSLGNSFQTIMGTRGNGPANGFLLQVNNNTVRAVGPQADHFVLDAALPAGINLNDGEYHDIQIKWVKDTELSIFVDGQKIGTHTPTGAVTQGVHNLEIGRNPKNQASYFTGEIDGVKVENDVKTEQEIADEYMAKILGNEASPVDYTGIEDLGTTTMVSGAVLRGAGHLVLNGSNYAEADSNHHYGDYFTATAWFRTIEHENSYGVLMSSRLWDGAPNGFALAIKNAGAHLHHPQMENTHIEPTFDHAELSDGQWHQAVLRWKADEDFAAFIDGVEVGSLVPSGAVNAGVGQLIIGSEPAGFTGKFIGHIDGVKVENVYKSDAEIMSSFTGNPIITLLGDNPLAIAYQDPTVDPGASAVDHPDGDLTAQISSDWDSVIGADPVPGNHVVTYSVTDSDGNQNTVTREVAIHALLQPDLYFDGSSLDAIVGDNSLVLAADTSIDSSSGKYGDNSYSYGPTGDKLPITFENSVDTTSGTYTFSMWFYNARDTSEYRAVLRQAATGMPVNTRRLPIIIGPNNELGHQLMGTLTWTGYDMTPHIAQNAWTHLAVVADGVDSKYYINGFHVGTAAGVIQTGITELGSYGGGGGDATFAEGLDEIAYWPRALSDDEVYTIGATNSPLLQIDTLLTAPPPPVVTADLEENYPDAQGVSQPVTLHEDGMLIGGMYIDSENGKDYVSGVFTDNLRPVAEDVSFSFSAFYRTDNDSSGANNSTHDLFDCFDSGNNAGWKIQVNPRLDTKWSLILSADGATVLDTGEIGSVDSEFGKFHHTAFTLQGGELKVYLNGVLVHTANGVSFLPSVPANGQYKIADDSNSIFATDKVTIYKNQVLTQEEITALQDEKATLDANYTYAFPSPLPPVPTMYFDGSTEESQNGSYLLTPSNISSFLSTSNGKYGNTSFFYDVTGQNKASRLSPAVDLPDEYTISLWFYNMRPGTGGHRNIISTAATANGDSNGHVAYVHQGTGALRQYIGGFINTGYNIHNAGLAADTWHHIVMVAEDGGTTMYINGEKVGSKTNALDSRFIKDIGGIQGNTQTFAEGIDEIAYWPVALSMIQIINLYHSALPLSDLDSWEEHAISIPAPNLYFDGSSTDSQIGSNSVSFAGAGALTTTNGKYGNNSFYFGTSANNYMNLSSNIPLSTGVYTFSLWFYNKRSNNSHATILKSSALGLAGARYVMMTYGSNDQLGVFDVVNGSTKFFGSGYNLTDGVSEWTHLAVVADGTNSTFYVNGHLL